MADVVCEQHDDQPKHNGSNTRTSQSTTAAAVAAISQSTTTAAVAAISCRVVVVGTRVSPAHAMSLGAGQQLVCQRCFTCRYTVGMHTWRGRARRELNQLPQQPTCVDDNGHAYELRQAANTQGVHHVCECCAASPSRCRAVSLLLLCLCALLAVCKLCVRVCDGVGAAG